MDTDVRRGTALRTVATVAGLSAVAAALAGSAGWRPWAVAALLALAGYAAVTGRGGPVAAGVALLAGATAIRQWWGLPDGRARSATEDEQAGYWAAVLERERIAAVAVLLAVVTLAVAVARRPPGADVRRWAPAAAAVAALAPGAVVAVWTVQRFRDSGAAGTSEAVALGWAVAPAAVAVVVAAGAALVAAAGRGLAATGGAVLLGALAAVTADAVAGAWLEGVPYRNPPSAFLEPGMIISSGGAAVRWDAGAALAGAVVLGAAALTVAGARRAPRDD